MEVLVPPSFRLMMKYIKSYRQVPFHPFHQRILRVVGVVLILLIPHLKHEIVEAKVVQCQMVKTLLVLEFLSVFLNFVVCVATSVVSMTVVHSACHLMAILQITIKPQ